MTAAIRLPERAAADALIAAMREEMPLLAFMGVEVEACDGHSLTLQAPLAPNRNDKGTAFAGSLASLSTVTGWALLTRGELWRLVTPALMHFSILHILFNLVDSLGISVPISDNLRNLKPETLNFLGKITNRRPEPNGNGG